MDIKNRTGARAIIPVGVSESEYAPSLNTNYTPGESQPLTNAPEKRSSGLLFWGIIITAVVGGIYVFGNPRKKRKKRR